MNPRLLTIARQALNGAFLDELRGRRTVELQRHLVKLIMAVESHNESMQTEALKELETLGWRPYET